ncbi:hypothetical protein IFM89_011465 [Coptis chinensis]|uniref:BSD domain-containing protein n=1 Tax=Coptis chinensis TaxID=261450 RepID=A0A835MCD2_9MAGN|nr:hypothetical protein IFM89_011465 [Coptis chinensis]
MDFWARARNFAEETAKRSHEFTINGSSKISDIVSETAKKSKEIAAKKADEIKMEALKRAEQIKSLAENISAPQIPLVDSSANSAPSDAELDAFGVTDDLREFVKGITHSTFQDFPIQDGPEISEIPTLSNVRQDLTEWQERHATLVLLTVKEISSLRYQLCPRHMKERKFWKIYFILVNTHVAPEIQDVNFYFLALIRYEKRYMEEKLKSAEKEKDDELKENPPVGTSSKPESTPTIRPKTSTSSAEQDLDVFLLGDLGSSDEGPDDADGGFDDDFDNSDDEDEKQLKKK